MSLLIEKLSAVYPILSSVSDCISDTGVKRVILASRNNTITVASLIKSSSISTMFDRLAPASVMPQELKMIAQRCHAILVDIDSVSQSTLRFYVYIDSVADLPWFMDRYKCVVPDTVKQPNFNELNLIGFLIDSTTGELQQYKYYFNYFQIEVYRFTGQTDFVNYSTNTPIYGKNNIPLDRFNLTDFDFTGLTVKHVIRDNADQFYINIVETFDDNIGSFPPGPGGGVAVAPRL